MNKKEALKLLNRRIEDLRPIPYRDLLHFLDNAEATDVVGPSGRRYSMETEAFWDDRTGGNLRVRVGIHDGGWRAFEPLFEDFIKSPDDRFVDEP